MAIRTRFAPRSTGLLHIIARALAYIGKHS